MGGKMNTRELMKEKLDDFEKKIGYTFKDKNNAILALTHSSYANEKKNEKLQSNERLEFLGDAVLNIVISESLFTRNSELAEGDMTKVRANIVCEASLIKCSEKLNIGDYLLLGKGEELTGGRTRISILSDAFEAVIGAIYIDGGLDNAREFILRNMDGIIGEALKGTLLLDFKTQLQETVQKNNDCKIIYEIIDEKGPDHDKTFVTQVKINDKVMGSGKGKSKKEAEQNAAKSALEKYNEKEYSCVDSSNPDRRI